MQILHIFLTLLAFLSVCLHATVVFTNVECKTGDANFCNVEYCYLRSVNRSYKYFSMRINLYQVPIDNMTVHFALLKKANGYKPFLYNKTVNGCKYLKTRNNVVVRYFHSWFERYSNMNHSCPYDHDLIVDKLTTTHISDLMTKVLPIPFGQYMFHANWIAYNVLRATVKVYLTSM